MVEIKNTQEVKREKPKMTKQQKREIISYTVTLCSFAVLCYMGYLISDFYIKNHTFKWQSPILFQKPLIIEVKKELKSESKIEVVKPVEAKVPFCYDPITCIRDIGESVGVTNKEIMTMIRIADKESTMNPLAKNPESSAKGLFQILDGTWKQYQCTGDVFNFEDNTKCAYRILKGYNKIKGQGFNAWEVCKTSVNCN